MTVLALLTAADASVVVATVAAGGSLVLAVLNNRATRRVETATRPNGNRPLQDGGSMADALIRIEQRLDAGGQRMARIEQRLDDVSTDTGHLRGQQAQHDRDLARLQQRLDDRSIP